MLSDKVQGFHISAPFLECADSCSQCSCCLCCRNLCVHGIAMQYHDQYSHESLLLLHTFLMHLHQHPSIITLFFVFLLAYCTCHHSPAVSGIAHFTADLQLASQSGQRWHIIITITSMPLFPLTCN